MSSNVTIVYAFDPVAQLDGRSGMLIVAIDLARQLVDEHLAELAEPNMSKPMRYVLGSAAHTAARDELRAARAGADELVSVRAVLHQRPAARKTARRGH